MSDKLTKIESGAIGEAQSAPTIIDMMQAVIKGGVTPENVSALKELAALHERMEDKRAEREFATAFNALQAETPRVKAMKAVPGNDGNVRYHFAPYEDIMDAVAPLLQKHGFTVRFSMKFSDGRVTQICTLQHTSGHSKDNEFSVRVGQGPPKSSEAQGDGAAATYAKRFALCSCLNITIEKDSDARVEGGKITQAQADDLRTRVRASGADEARFLAFAGASKYEDIVEAKYAMLDQNLRKKEKTT